MRRILIIALLFAATAASGRSAGEDVFESAKHWTVQIRTSVDRAFIEDFQGSFSGAGLVVDADRGWVLTNAHVASHSFSDIEIVFHGARPVRGERVYVDPYLDLAIVSYDPQALPAKPAVPELECATIPAVGHPVGAFGHPRGFRFTGTRGIASAVTSRLGPAMLQTDAPINHGNSGGPLISLETGRVVGVNAAIIDKDLAEGLNFAVPMPYACTLIDLLRQGRDPSPPADLVDFANDENGEPTLLVARSRLPRGSLDLRAGDIVLGVGTAATSLGSQTGLVDSLRGNLDDVTLQVERDGQATVIHGAWPAAPKVTERQALWISGALFADAETLTSGQLAGAPRLMVHHVEPGSAAENMEIAASDLLVSADGEPVDSLAKLQGLADRAAAGHRKLALLFLRLASSQQDQLFVYETRSLDASDVERIGPPMSVAASTRRARSR
jgi:S1-C subfamily serine protease